VLADDEAAAAFARDGVVCPGSVLSEAEVAAAAAPIDAVLACAQWHNVRVCSGCRQ
jgi:hypothetical protein